MKALLKKIALLGWATLQANAHLNVETVLKPAGVYLKAEIYIFDRVLLSRAVKIANRPSLDHPEEPEKIPVIDFEYWNAERARILEQLKKSR